MIKKLLFCVINESSYHSVGSRVEVAVLGTALPVLLSISPSPVLRFGDCPVGKQVDALCTVNNESASLPLIFFLHSTAHFHSSPQQEHIAPGESLEVLLSFRPNQMGTFKPIVPLDVLGGITEAFSFDGDPTATKYVNFTSTFGCMRKPQLSLSGFFFFFQGFIIFFFIITTYCI